jgi:hypothetical protein
VLVIVLAVAGGAAFLFNRDSIDSAKVGDCASYDSSKSDNPFKKVDCNDAAAQYTVLQIVSGSQECKTVAGAERSITSKGNEICMGKKDVDPNTAVNVAKAGDCLTIIGDDAVRVDCGSPKATHKVLKRLTNVLDATASSACDDVPDSVGAYTWTWQTDNGGKASLPSLNDDVVLCVGDLK